tara:strand:+ start:282 stop:536 length:255 start_codon:yes stop_codon:yes gene_type:complete
MAEGNLRLLLSPYPHLNEEWKKRKKKKNTNMFEERLHQRVDNLWNPSFGIVSLSVQMESCCWRNEAWESPTSEISRLSATVTIY